MTFDGTLAISVGSARELTLLAMAIGLLLETLRLSVPVGSICIIGGWVAVVTHGLLVRTDLLLSNRR